MVHHSFSNCILNVLLIDLLLKPRTFLVSIRYSHSFGSHLSISLRSFDGQGVNGLNY